MTCVRPNRSSFATHGQTLMMDLCISSVLCCVSVVDGAKSQVGERERERNEEKERGIREKIVSSRKRERKW